MIATIGAGRHVLEVESFIVIIDEATQTRNPVLVPINRGCRQLILVGDHRQLPPTVISETAEIGGLGQSLLSDSTSVDLVFQMLTTVSYASNNKEFRKR